jgi:hypothetical protein
MNARQQNLDTAEVHTFEWIFHDKETGFADWLASGKGLFWIKGRPGSGKSTLIKYVYENDETIQLLEPEGVGRITTASFFFYEQGTETSQKSFEGLLASILHQILDTIQEMFPFIQSIFESIQQSNSWSRADLDEAFHAIASQTEIQGCMCLFIDALDEYAGNHAEVARELKKLLSKFSNSSFKIKICASSRELNEFETMFEEYPGFAIHEKTENDIETYVSQRLGEAKRDDMPNFLRDIKEMARGVFLWVKLVMEEISTSLFNGDTEEEICQALSILPADLTKMYTHILGKVPPTKQQSVRSVLQMMFCNGTRLLPLTIAEISIAVRISDQDRPQLSTLGLQPKDDYQRCHRFWKFIKGFLGGFLELEPNHFKRGTLSPECLTSEEYDFTISTIRFSHRTAKEYIFRLIKMDIFQPEVWLDNLLAGHLSLMAAYNVLAKDPRGLYVSSLRFPR